MAIQRPNPFYTRSQRRLITLLTTLLQEIRSPQIGMNEPDGHVVFSENDADELAGLIDDLLESGEFLEESYFIESLTQTEFDDPSLRRLFESAQRRRGRFEPMAWLHFNEFQHRLFYQRTLTNAKSVPMKFEHFLSMERLLFKTLGFQSRVIDAAITLLQQQRDTIERLRAREESLKNGTIRDGFRQILGELRRRESPRTIRPERVAGAATVLANLGCLFTSRDWGVTGTISAFGGACVMSALR